MHSLTDVDPLSDKQYLFVILRLLLDEHRTLLHGELVDEQGTPLRHFLDWDGVIPAIQGWLALERFDDRPT